MKDFLFFQLIHFFSWANDPVDWAKLSRRIIDDVIVQL